MLYPLSNSWYNATVQRTFTQRGKTMAEIYSQDGNEITVGLQGSIVCDEAMQAAKVIAMDRGEAVRLEDGGESWDVHPDGTVEEADSWEN